MGELWGLGLAWLMGQEFSTVQETQREAGLGRESIRSAVSVGAFSILGNYEFPRQLQGTSEPHW